MKWTKRVHKYSQCSVRVHNQPSFLTNAICVCVYVRTVERRRSERERERESESESQSESGISVLFATVKLLIGVTLLFSLIWYYQ